MSGRDVTILVEPDPGGHRFQFAAMVANVAARSSEVVLLTSKGAMSASEYGMYIADAPVRTLEVFDGLIPPAREMAKAATDVALDFDAATIVVMDGDTPLKKWWLVAPPEFRRLPRRPRVVFLLTRYIARLSLDEYHAILQRVAKALLVLAGMLTRSIDRVGGFAGRDDFSNGVLVKRIRDTATCGSHARDRDAIRRELGLPVGVPIVGIVGTIDARKSIPLVFDAIVAADPKALLLVAGKVSPDVAEWLEALTPEASARVVQVLTYLDTETMDKYVAACDVISSIQLNKGSSGVMGKALAAGVPVITAGSRVRASELKVTKGGVATDMEADSITRGLRGLFDDRTFRGIEIPPATDETFASQLLGVGTN